MFKISISLLVPIFKLYFWAHVEEKSFKCSENFEHLRLHDSWVKLICWGRWVCEMIKSSRANVARLFCKPFSICYLLIFSSHSTLVTYINNYNNVAIIVTGEFTFTGFAIFSQDVTDFTVAVGFATVGPALVHTASILICTGILHCNTKSTHTHKHKSTGACQVGNTSGAGVEKTVKTDILMQSMWKALNPRCHPAPPPHLFIVLSA